MTSGLLGINNTGARWRINQAQSSASMLERMMRDELSKGRFIDVLDRAREVEELVKLHVLERRDSLMLQLLAAQLLELASSALNDAYARKADYFIGNIFAAEELPPEVLDESERFRVRLWLNRGNVERARHYVDRIDREIEVIPQAGAGLRPLERVGESEENIRPATWLLLAEVSLAESNFPEADRALKMARSLCLDTPLLQEEKVLFEFLRALERIGSEDQSGCACLAHLYSTHVLNESSVGAQWRARISAASGYLDQVEGISSLETARWRELGPPVRELIDFYLGHGDSPDAPPIFDDGDVTSLMESLGEQPQAIVANPTPLPVSALSYASFPDPGVVSEGVLLDFSLQEKRIDDQTDILMMERATGRLVFHWNQCDPEVLQEAVQGSAISELALRVSSGSIFFNEGMYVDALLHTDDSELLGMSAGDVIFELYRIAMARLPGARARQIKNDHEGAPHETVRIKVWPKDFNMEVCRRIDVLNAQLAGVELKEEQEEIDPFDNWTSFGPKDKAATDATVVENHPDPEKSAELLKPFESIFSANSLNALCQAAVKSVEELGAQGSRCEVTTEDESAILAVAGDESSDAHIWCVLEAGPLRLRLGVLSISADYQKLMRMVMDAALHRLRVMPGTRYRGRSIDVPGFIASDSRTQEMLETVRVFAGKDKNILISGERGTGKEHIAHLLHKWSNRADRPFVPVDAGLLNNPELLAAELYGSTKGSYTGSVNDRPGLVQVANGGVLFIDEIDEGVSVQSVLKRFAQFGTFKTVGQAREQEADVRLIIATNQIGDGGALIKEDLRDRFWEIRVLPLRDRREDIRPLAEFFARQFEMILPDNVLAWLGTLEWPGNIRQLQNVVERACSLAQTPANLNLELIDDCVERSGGKTIVRMTSGEPSFVPLKLGETLNERLLKDEKRYIMAAMTAAGGNKTRAAEILGMQRPSLHGRLKTLGIEMEVK